MGVIRQETQWFRQLSKQIIEGLDGAANCDFAAREQLPFDLADVMERGFACELATHFEESQDVDELRELSIRRASDHQEFTLLSEAGRAILIARPLGRRGSDALSFDIYVAGDGDPPAALGPAFRLAHIEKTESWELRSASCPACEYRSPGTKRNTVEGAQRALMRIQQERRAVGPGFCMTMDVELPTPNSAWCVHCAAALHPRLPIPASLRLTSRRPKWNERLKSLTLDFKGRCSQASAKNFQLTTRPAGEGTAADAALQCGKMASGDFCLDFRGPLGPVQAFAAALTTASWL